MDLANRQIEEAFLVKVLEDLLTVERGERPGRCGTRAAECELPLAIECGARQVQGETSTTPADRSCESLQVGNQGTALGRLIGPSVSKSATFF